MIGNKHYVRNVVAYKASVDYKRASKEPHLNRCGSNYTSDP